MRISLIAAEAAAVVIRPGELFTTQRATRNAVSLFFMSPELQLKRGDGKVQAPIPSPIIVPKNHNALRNAAVTISLVG